jgi:hypothetical protein
VNAPFGFAPSRRRRLIASCVLGFALSLPGVARATDLSWSGPADCAQSEALVFQVERALGASLAETGQLHLQVHVARTAPTARALLRIADDAPEPSISERKLDAPSCEKLVDTLAVAITLAIEAAAPVPEAPAIPKAPARAAPPPVAAVPAAPQAALDVPEDEPEGGSAGPVPRVLARVLADVGSLPGPALGVGLGAQLGWPWLQLELVGTLWAEQHTRLEATPSAGADLSLATGALSVCTSPLGASTIAIALCVGAEVGRASGIGTGISAPRQASGLWLAPTADVGLTFRPSERGVGIGARIGAAAPLGRDPFYLERLGTVYQAESLVARVSLGLDVSLP